MSRTPLTTDSYLDLIQTQAQSRNYAALPQLLSLPSICLAFSTSNGQNGSNSQNFPLSTTNTPAQGQFFRDLITRSTQNSLLPSNTPFAAIFNPQITSMAHLWAGISMINGARTGTSNLTTLTPSILQTALKSFQSSFSSILQSHEALMGHLRSNLPSGSQSSGNADKVRNETTQWHPLVTSLYSHFRLSALLLDTFTSLRVHIEQTQMMAALYIHDNPDNGQNGPTNDPKSSKNDIIEFSDLQLVSHTALTELSNCLKRTISTINSDQTTQVFEPISLAACVNSIFSFFSYHSTQYSAILRQLSHLSPQSLSSYPSSDRVQYHYCIGSAALTKKDYATANYELTRALQLVMAYPSQQQQQNQNNFQNNQNKNSQNSILIPNTQPVLSQQQLHNMRLIVQLLCPLRLLSSSGSFSTQNSIGYGVQNGQNGQNNTQMVQNDPISSTLYVDGLFSPLFLESLSLDILAALSRSVVSGDLYVYNYILQSHVRYFISTGIYPIVQKLSASTWLHLFSSLYTKVLIGSQNSNQANVVRWDLVLTALAVQKRRAVGKIKALQGQNGQNNGQNGQNGLKNSPNDLGDYILEDYDVTDIECVVAQLIYTNRIKAYFKPGVALVMAKVDTFAPSWGKTRSKAMGIE